MQQKQQTSKSIFLLTIPMLVSLTASATALTGSGTLILPAPCPGAGCGSAQLGVGLNIPSGTNISTGFSGSWGATAATPWQGTVNATATGVGSGPSYPSSAVGASTTVWNFSGLNATYLPSGTYVALGDLDAGSGSGEMFVLKAFDTGGNPITGNWLDSPAYISSLTVADFVAGSMPAYSVSNGVYTFDGTNVAGNPTLTVWLATNTNIGSLSVQKFTTNNGFGLDAPAAAPEPGTLLLMSAGILGLGFARKRFRN